MSDSNEKTSLPARQRFAGDGNAHTPPKGSSTSSSEEISSGARRLAKELREFITDQQEKTGGATNHSLDMQYGSLSLELEDNIVDLQMATCRKLREVRT